jgi:hypothetical protein
MKILVALLVMVVMSTSVFAKTAVIVSQKSNHTVDKEYARDMFAGKKTIWPDGAKVVLADQSGSTVGEKFYDTFVGVSIRQYRRTMLKLVLSGSCRKPIKCANDQEVKKAVSGDENVIGFIDESAVDETV